jgi:hypothetical protein
MVALDQSSVRGKDVVEVIALVGSVAVGLVAIPSAGVSFHVGSTLTVQDLFVGMLSTPAVALAKSLVPLAMSVIVVAAAIAGVGRFKLAIAIGALLMARFACG